MEHQESTSAQAPEPVEAAGLGDLQNVMRAHGIATVRIAVNGYNDQGHAELEAIDPPEAGAIEIDGGTLEDFCQHFGADITSDCYPGWELGDGGSGAITVTPDEARLEIGWNDEKYTAETPVLLTGTAEPLGLLRHAMQKHGIMEIRLQVSGYGDRGFGDLLATTPPDMGPVSLGKETLTDICEAFAVEVADEHYPGWELGEGSAGTITVTPDIAKFEFGWRIESIARELPVFLVPEPPEADAEVIP